MEQRRPLTADQMKWYQDFTNQLQALTTAASNAAYAQMVATKGRKRESLDKCRDAETALAVWVVRNPYPTERARRRQ
jgi:hypothetical protein